MAEFRFADLTGRGADMSALELFLDRLAVSNASTLRFRDGDDVVTYSGEFATRRGAVTGALDAVEARRDGVTLFTGADLDADAGDFLDLVKADDAAGALRLLTAGDDRIFGARFADRLAGNAGADEIRGRGGDDRIEGGGGADRLRGDGGADLLRGDGGKDRLHGGDGDDRLIGGDGRDQLRGDAGRDVMIGGAGGDRFVFADRFDFAPREAPDEIRDFSRAEGDRIDLSALDANTLAAGAQSFDFVGRAGFSGAAGELRFKNGILSGDVQGDRRADFHIAVDDATRLAEGDFIL